MIGPKTARPSKKDEALAMAIVANRDEGMCQKCLQRLGTNTDHRKNRSQGGRTAASNLQLLCGSGTTGCHGWKTNNPDDALAEGWAVPQYGDPSRWPAARWLRQPNGTVRLGWVLFDDVGQWVEISPERAEDLSFGVVDV